MIPENAQHMGLFPRFKALLFGDRAARLTESLTRTHWLSYLLIVSQSIAVVLVLGHSELPLLLTGSWAIRALASMVFFVLVATVFASDLALLETLRRISALKRNRQRWAHHEHMLYVGFVLLVEASTYAVVIAVLDRDPNALLSAKPLIPTHGPIFWALVLLRAALIVWTTVQLVIVRGKLPVLLSTLTNTGKEIVGAHVERQLADLDIKGVTLPDTFRTYAAMARPPRRVRTWYNSWFADHELAQEAEEERQVRNVVDALEDLERRRIRDAQPEPPTPPRGGIPAPAPAAVDGSLNPLAEQQVRTIVQSAAETAPVSGRLYVVKDAPKGRKRNAPGRRIKKSNKRDTSSVEALARAAWRDGMTVSELQAEAGISRAAASKYLKIFSAEQNASATA